MDRLHAISGMLIVLSSSAAMVTDLTGRWSGRLRGNYRNPGSITVC